MTNHDDTIDTVGDFDDLVARLIDLGGALSLDDDPDAMAIAVQERRDASDAHRSAWSGARLWVAAAVLLVVVAGVLLVPDARSAVARWFGIDGAVIEVDPSGEWAPVFEAPPIGDVRTVDVGGREVNIATLEGRLDEVLVRKTLASADQIQEVTVDGHLGLWISGAVHRVVVEHPDGHVGDVAVAGNTLLWSDGTSVFRVEGFDRRDEAIAYVEMDTVDARQLD